MNGSEHISHESKLWNKSCFFEGEVRRSLEALRIFVDMLVLALDFLIKLHFELLVKEDKGLRFFNFALGLGENGIIFDLELCLSSWRSKSISS